MEQELVDIFFGIGSLGMWAYLFNELLDWYNFRKKVFEELEEYE